MAQPIKILVLDHFNLGHLYKKLEGHKEYSFQITTSLHKCFIHLATEKPDIMVLPYIASVNDPKQDILTIAATNKIPFITMSSEATQERVVKSVRDGAMDFLLTSIDGEEFIKRVNTVLVKCGKPPPLREEVEEFALEDSMSGIEKVLTVLDKAKEVKAMPYSVTKVISLCSDPKSSVSDIVMPIKTDAALSSSILRHSNSVVYYRGMPKVQNISDAIVRIGLEETKETCLVHAVYSMFEKSNKTFGFDRYQFWIHSLGTGIIAKKLAHILDFERKDAALLAGVLHDLGKMIMDDYFNKDYDKIIRRAATQHRILFHIENEILDTNHSFIGGRIAGNWRFPEIISYAIKHHHDYARSFLDGGSSINLATIVFVANYLAKAMVLGSGSDFYVTPIPNVVWSKLGFEYEIPRGFVESVHQELAYYYSFLKIPKDAAGKQPCHANSDMRILLLSSSPIANTYVRLYLANCGYDYAEGSVGAVPSGEYDLIIYDFLDELEPREMEFMIKAATDFKEVPALFIYGGVNDILVLQKMHKAVESLLLPLDMFAFDQVIRNFDPKAGKFSDTILDRSKMAASAGRTGE